MALRVTIKHPQTKEHHTTHIAVADTGKLLLGPQPHRQRIVGTKAPEMAQVVASVIKEMTQSFGVPVQNSTGTTDELDYPNGVHLSIDKSHLSAGTTKRDASGSNELTGHIHAALHRQRTR